MRHFNRKCRKIRKLLFFDNGKKRPVHCAGRRKNIAYYCFSFTIKMGKGGSFLRFRKSHFITA